MKLHKPIKTIYKDEEYRSRLEARYAIFFDKLGFMYSYEPYSIPTTDNSSYLPDFEIFGQRVNDYIGKTQSVFIEVKPAKPNRKYLDHLMSLDIKNDMMLLVFAGIPNRNQPNGFIISQRYSIESDVFFRTIEEGFYFDYCCFCNRFVAQPYDDYLKNESCWFCEKDTWNQIERDEEYWKNIEEEVKYFRFDLEEKVNG